MQFRGAPGDRQAEPAAARLGREERLEDLVADLQRGCPDRCRATSIAARIPRSVARRADAIPRPFMACAAFNSRFSTVARIRSGSAVRLPSSLSVNVQRRSDRIAAQHRDRLVEQVAHVDVREARRRGRANIIRSWISSFNASMRATMSRMTAASLSSLARRDISTCMAPLMPASGFLTSCATTAAIWPRRASAACCARRSSAAFRAVMSARIAMYWYGLPRASRNGTIVVSTQ